MRHYAGLIHLVFILALSVSTLGSHADNDCTPQQSHEGKTLHDILVESLHKCFGKVGNLDLQTLVGNDSPSKTRSVVGEYCHRQDLIKSCLLSQHSSMCPNETQYGDYIYVEDILKTGLSYSCAGDGKYLVGVLLFVFLDENSTLERNAFTDCITTSKSTGAGGDSLDTSIRFLTFYQEIRVFKQCLVNRLRGFNGAVFGAELMLNGILRSMKCPHPEDGTTVLCETLDAAPSTEEEKVCPFIGMNDSDPPTYTTVLNFAAECALVNLNQLNFDHLQFLTRIEDFHAFVNTHCQNRLTIRNCLSDISANSKVCLNETDHQFTELFKYILEFSLETGCKENGTKFATIYNGIFNPAERAIGFDTMRDCSNAAEKMYKSGSHANDTRSTQTVLLYRSADALKKCVLDGSSEVGSFKTAFATFTNEILRAAKCVADDGNLVLCETLLNDY